MATKTANAWREECNYIDGVADKKGKVHEMNYKLDTFISYCKIQCENATRQGFHDAATHIQHVLDDLQTEPTRCPWCGASGPGYDESPRPATTCDHG